MRLISILTVLILAAVLHQAESVPHQVQCQHAGGPVRQSTIINYLKNLVKPFIPFAVPSVEIDVATGLKLNASNIFIQTLDFASANMQLTQPNTVYFTLTGLTASISLDWTIGSSSNTQTGTAKLVITPSDGSITAYIEPDQFKNINATFTVGDITLQTTNQPAIEPYWEFLKPILIDTLQHEVPNIILELNTAEIKTLVYPIVTSVEPIHIPDLNATVLGIYGGFSNIILSNIDFESATMGRGATDNEVVFELVQVTALINNDWEFSALGIDQQGKGHVDLNQTTVAITVGLSENSSGEFTINLDNAKIVIGHLDIKVDSGDSTIINWLIQVIEPLLVTAIENSFQTVVCILFNGIPN